MARYKQNIKVLISGGGTGGHVFPAIAIANAIKGRDEKAKILFVGAKNRMEMEKVPEAGYEVVGLPIAGFQRKLTLQNFTFFPKLIKSLMMASAIIRHFNPDVVVGVGGYASGPVLKRAADMGIPTLIQEQNSYAGATNRLLAKKAHTICVAYENMENYFPKEKIVLTGNPVRKNINANDDRKDEARKHFRLNNQKVVLVVGGSLGAKSINEALLHNHDFIEMADFQLIWQTGKFYFNEIKNKVGQSAEKNIRIYDFISRMDLAYSIADVVVSRSGALSISELSLVGKPVILVPSPNVAEDHQTKNAQYLVNNKAAIMIPDHELKTQMKDVIQLLLDDEKMQKELSKNIKKMAIKNSDEIIANEVFKLIR